MGFFPPCARNASASEMSCSATSCCRALKKRSRGSPKRGCIQMGNPIWMVESLVNPCQRGSGANECPVRSAALLCEIRPEKSDAEPGEMQAVSHDGARGHASGLLQRHGAFPCPRLLFLCGRFCFRVSLVPFSRVRSCPFRHIPCPFFIFLWQASVSRRSQANLVR